MSIQGFSKNAQAIVGLSFVVGLGLIILSKFKEVSGSTATSNTAIDTFIAGLDDYADWIGIIVLVGVGVYLLAQFAKARG